MRKIIEVVCDHVDDDNYQYIDVYFDADANSSGKIVAVVCLDTAKVFFIDHAYRNNDMVVGAIKGIIAGIDKSQHALNILREDGCFVDNLWSIADVQNKYHCSDERAQKVLGDALTNEYVIGEIHDSITISADEKGLPSYSDIFFEVSGYWKDDKENPFSGYIVCAYDECPDSVNEDDVFYFGLNESDLQNVIDDGEDTCEDFVITGYEKRLACEFVREE